jgi:hypothetical protein
MADYGTDFSDDVDPNFDANARPQQGSTVEITVGNRDPPGVSPFSSLGGFPDSRFPIRRESGKREAPFPDSESAGTGNRVTSWGPGGGGPGISSVVWGVASALAYLTASARTLTRAGRLPGQCQWHQLSPGGPSGSDSYYRCIITWIITTSKWVDHSLSECAVGQTSSDSERAHCQEREFPQHWPLATRGKPEVPVASKGPGRT